MTSSADQENFPDKLIIGVDGFRRISARLPGFTRQTKSTPQSPKSNGPTKFPGDHCSKFRLKVQAKRILNCFHSSPKFRYGGGGAKTCRFGFPTQRAIYYTPISFAFSVLWCVCLWAYLQVGSETFRPLSGASSFLPELVSHFPLTLHPHFTYSPAALGPPRLSELISSFPLYDCFSPLKKNEAETRAKQKRGRKNDRKTSHLGLTCVLPVHLLSFFLGLPFAFSLSCPFLM